jgi:type I restriction enzyme R subunit
MEFRDSIETKHQQQATNVGLSETELAFYNILNAEIIRITDNESLSESTHDEVIQVVKDLVGMLNDATAIVNFFDKHDEIKSVKRRILETSFDDAELRKVVMERFMELARVKFK